MPRWNTAHACVLTTLALALLSGGPLGPPASAQVPNQVAAATAAVPCQAGCVNARERGAPANGVTDAWPVLQRLASQLAAGEVLYLPQGTYLLSRPLRLSSQTRLVGDGAGQTTVLLDRRSWARFSFGFLITSATSAGVISSDVTVSGLTVNGNRTNVHPGDGSPGGRANAGGGIKAGNRWVISEVRLTNLNYFKAWIYHVSTVTIRHCVFDALGGSASDNDNIGGGRSSGVVLDSNTIDATATGNAVDLVRATQVTISNNLINGAPGSSHPIYLDGVAEATITGNRLRYAGISVQSESHYHLTRPVQNPRHVVVANNVLEDTPSQGISVRYDTSPYGQLPGGGNRIAGNTVRRAGLAGIAIIGCGPGQVVEPDTVARNTVVNAFGVAQTTWGTGCGSFDPAGIGVWAGVRDTIVGNTIVDTRPPALTWWGISLRAHSGGTPIVAAFAGNTAAGVRCGLLVLASGTPYAGGPICPAAPPCRRHDQPIGTPGPDPCRGKGITRAAHLPTTARQVGGTAGHVGGGVHEPTLPGGKQHAGAQTGGS
jgi:hypothetical protein